MERVQVFRGQFGDPVALFGPLPGLRDGRVIAYEFGLSEDRFLPWPGGTLLQRVYVLLDFGVALNQPCWKTFIGATGEPEEGMDEGSWSPSTWYVDLLDVEAKQDTFILRDLYADVMVPVDGRHQRLLDLDEFADALEAGVMTLDIAVDGLRRWQQFLDVHLHQARNPTGEWTNFPPAAICALYAVQDPLGPLVTHEWPQVGG